MQDIAYISHVITHTTARNITHHPCYTCPPCLPYPITPPHWERLLPPLVWYILYIYYTTLPPACDTDYISIVRLYTISIYLLYYINFAYLATLTPHVCTSLLSLLSLIPATYHLCSSTRLRPNCTLSAPFLIPFCRPAPSHLCRMPTLEILQGLTAC